MVQRFSPTIIPSLPQKPTWALGPISTLPTRFAKPCILAQYMSAFNKTLDGEGTRLSSSRWDAAQPICVSSSALRSTSATISEYGWHCT